MKKILFLANIPSPYRVAFYNELGKKCDLTVIFDRTFSFGRDKSWSTYSCIHFKAIFLRGLPFREDSAFCPGIVRYIKRELYDHIIVTNFSDPTGVMAISYMKANHIPYEIESDGGFAKNGKGLKENLKKMLISGATRWYSTSQIHDEYYCKYGASKKGIIRYPFTSVYEREILDQAPSVEDKRLLRNRLGMNEKFIVLSVGQFIQRKGFDLLIQASELLTDEIGLYFIGGEPTKEYEDLKKKYRNNCIHFVGFLEKEKLREYYQAADIFVLPTREDIWGLVINEAMANGLPVITTNRCIAGIELVDNKNGAIVHIEAVDEISNEINRILSDEETKNLMAKFSIVKIRQYTIEKMAEAHITTFEALDKLDCCTR